MSQHVLYLFPSFHRANTGQRETVSCCLRRAALPSVQHFTARQAALAKCCYFKWQVVQGHGRSNCQSLSSPQTACCQQFPKSLHLITFKAQNLLPWDLDLRFYKA